MVVDGNDGAPVDGASDLMFTPDSKHVVYVAFRGEKSLIMVDAQVTGSGSSVVPGSLSCSPDGRSLSYYVRRDQQFFLAVSGIESDQGFPAMLSARPSYDAQGQVVAVALNAGEILSVRVNLAGAWWVAR